MNPLSRQEITLLLAWLRAEITMDAKHVYTTPAGVFPSVTTIIKHLDKPALMMWASKVQSEADEAEVIAWLQGDGKDEEALLYRLRAQRQAHKGKTKKAADMGTEGHKLAECEFRRQLGMDVAKPTLEHPEQAHMVLAGIMEWAKKHAVEPIAMEQPVYSRAHRYAGTGDLVAYVDGVLTFVDFKSNDRGRVYRESYLQNHALRGALREHGLDTAGLVLAVPRDGVGEINPVPVPWRDADYAAFVGLRAVHDWARMIG